MGASMEVDASTHNGDGNGTQTTDEKSLQTTQVELNVPTGDERDAQALARLGKKPVLKVCICLC